MTMIFRHLSRPRRAVALIATTALLIGGSVALAPSASAEPTDYCSRADRYLLLVDNSTNAAIRKANDDALCRVQESTLRQLSEQQWGEDYTDEQRARMLRWGRSDSLGAMYVELLRIAHQSSDDRSADEATVYAWLQTTLAALRSQLAEAAYAEQIRYQSDPCGYIPPTPGAAKIQCGNSGSLMTLFGPPPGPTYEQFVNYGAQRALTENFGTAQLTTIAAMARSARDQLIGAAVGVVGGIGIGVGMVAAATAGLAYSAMLVSVGAITASTTAATAAVSAVGAFIVSAAASVAFVALAVTLAVVRGIQVVQEAQIPDKLRADIATAKQPVDIEGWVGSDSSRATLLLQAVARRINNTQTLPSAPVPSSAGDDAQGFLVTGAVDDVTFTHELRFRSPFSTDKFFTAFMDHGWWVIQDDAGGSALTHTLVYVDHDGKTRSASWMAKIRPGADEGDPRLDGFLVTTSGVSAPSTTCTDDGSCTTTGCTEGGGCDSAKCTPANGCETTDALEIVTPSRDSSVPTRQSTARLATQPMTFTHLPTIDDGDDGFQVGASVNVFVEAEASYLTTMSYRWDVIRHDDAGDHTARIDDGDLNWTFTIPGDYRLVATAIASSGETVTHEWDVTVTGDDPGQLLEGIHLTQYPGTVTEPGDGQGPWLEGSNQGTICLATGSTEATNYTLEFADGTELTDDNVEDGYACFSRPASTTHAGVFHLAAVGACLASASLCNPPSGLIYVDGAWEQGSPFTYAVTNEPPTAGIDDHVSAIKVGLADDDLALSDIGEPHDFTAGDTVWARTVVSDAGDGPLTVHIRWSDGTEEVQSGIASGNEITATHQYHSVAWGPVGVQIWAVDDTGATGALATGWFVVHPRSATLTLNAAPVAGDDGLVTLTGTITDPDRTASLLGVDWGDGTSDGSGDGTGYVYEAPFPAPAGTEATIDAVNGTFQVSHRYAAGGTHTIQAYVWNSADGDIPIASTDVEVPKTAYSVASNGPIKVTATDVETHASTVSLDALLGNLSDDHLSVDADFGDGESSGTIADQQPGDTVPITHEFADGEHTITITVTDGSGATSQITRCFVLTDGVITPCTGTLPATDDDVRTNPSGPVDAPDSAQRGATITISLGDGHKNETVTLYLYSTPTLLGTFTADGSGHVSLTLPTSIPTGSHTVAAFVGAALVGWTPLTVASPGGSGGGSSSDSGGGTTDDGAAGSGSSGTESGSAGTESGAGGTGEDAGSSASEPSTGDVENAAGDSDASRPPALAATGARTRDLLELALLLLTSGAALVFAARRRSRHT